MFLLPVSSPLPPVLVPAPKFLMPLLPLLIPPPIRHWPLCCPLAGSSSLFISIIPTYHSPYISWRIVSRYNVTADPGAPRSSEFDSITHRFSYWNYLLDTSNISSVTRLGGVSICRTLNSRYQQVNKPEQGQYQVEPCGFFQILVYH